MIKRTNPDNENRKELAIELVKIRDRQTNKLKSDLEKIKEIKSKLIDTKIDLHKKEGVFYQLKLRLKINILSYDLSRYGLNTQLVDKLHDNSMKDIEPGSKSFRIQKSNEKVIKELLNEINKLIIKIEKEIKDWAAKNIKYKKLYKIM